MAAVTAPLYPAAMLGFHDHVTNPRSGRPEPHHSWVYERIMTWNAWAMSAVTAAGAVWLYAKWQEPSGSARLAGGAVLLAGIAVLRHRALKRRKEALRAATLAYEQMLNRGFD